MLTIILIGILIACAAYAIVSVYYKLYSRYTTLKVIEGKNDVKHMYDLPKFVLGVIVVVVLLYSVVITCVLKYSQKEGNDQIPIGCSVIELENYTRIGYSCTDEKNLIASKDASYVKVYSREENEGYKRNTSEQGDFIFTSFVRKGDHDGFHPDFFCFVDYVGENPESIYYENNLEFWDSDSMQNLLGHSTYPNTMKSFLVVGNMNQGNMFSIELTILESKMKDKYEADKRDILTEINEEKTSKKKDGSDMGKMPKLQEYATSISRYEIFLY